jgi:hypothetical protein
MAGAQAFKEAYISADLLNEGDFGDFEARKLRYSILWAFYENTAYRDIHTWAQGYRNRYGLYKYIRNIYNPSQRLADFYQMMVWGGLLDPEAGPKGAIPIKLGDKADSDLAAAITQVWQDSNWSVNKDIATLWGAALGDVAFKIIDDTEREQTRIEIVHPSIIKSVTMDKRNFVKGYEIEEVRDDPESGKPVTYLEVATRLEDNQTAIHYATYRNGTLYAWNGEEAEWDEDYGFVPFILVQHRSVGMQWGWAEIHPERSKVNEVDDQASMLNDQIRKTINPAWLFNFNKPSKTPQQQTAQATTDKPMPGREELQALYIDKPEAKGQALVAPLDIQMVSENIQKILQELERDYPELQQDIWSAQNDPSGKALGEARKKVESKVIQRRANYDSALVRAHQMAIAIGGMRTYAGFEGFSLESYQAGALDHSIDERPVFNASREEKDARAKLVWDTVANAVAQGIPPEAVLRDFGYTDEQLQNFGTQKLAAIKTAQEDKTTNPDGTPLKQ